jgi:Uma2 family endonuclease
MVSTADQEQKYTLSDYFELEEAAEEKHEFLNGKIVDMPGGTGPHNLISANMITALKIALKPKQSTFLVMGSDMKIVIEAFNRVRYPDAVVVSEYLDYYGGRQDVITNPLLIVEVLSDGTEKVDRGPKFEEYKTLPSFKEYVLISQQLPYITTYFREEDDLWRIRSISDLGGSVFLRSLDCTLSLSDIYEHIDFGSQATD